MDGRPSRYNTRHRDGLTPRQREVLDLLARGRTNFEIAEALGITLEGAKYHVSEILAKLGVESREEAAALWRHERGVRTRVVRALSPAGTLAWAAGGAAAVAATVAIALLVLAGDGNDTAPGASRLVGCQTEGVTLAMEPAADARILTVTYSVPRVPCLFGGGLSVVPYDLRNFSAYIPGLDRNRSSASFDDYVLQENAVSVRFAWRNWCSQPMPILFIVLSGLKYEYSSGAAILTTDDVPPCVSPSEPSRILRFEDTADAGAVNGGVAPDPGETPAADTCRPEDLEVNLNTEDPWEYGRDALLEPVIKATKPCRLDGDVRLTLQDAAGAPLGVRGNGARASLNLDVPEGGFRTPFRWANWCGAADPVVVRVEAAGSEWSFPARSKPNCQSRPPALGVSTLGPGWP